MKRYRSIRYHAAQPIELSLEDNIKIIKVEDDGEIVLSVNGKRITLIELERQINLNI